jgi:hypothetical protein
MQTEGSHTWNSLSLKQSISARAEMQSLGQGEFREIWTGQMSAPGTVLVLDATTLSPMTTITVGGRTTLSLSLKLWTQGAKVSHVETEQN